MDVLAWMGMATQLFLLLIPIIIFKNYLIYKKLASIKSTSFKFAFKPMFVLCAAPCLILSYPLFMVFRQIVNLILTYKLGSKYWGLLDGRDAFFSLENKNPGHALFIIKYPTNHSQSFYDAVKDAAYKALKSSTNPKIFGALRTFLGYSYIVKDEITFDDCFRKMDTMNFPIHKNDLIEAMEEYTSIPLPNNREALWDVFVGTQPVQWLYDGVNEKAEYYPVLFRSNHTLADFGHLINGIVKLFADNENVQFGCDAHIYQEEKLSWTGQQFSLALLLNVGRNAIKMVKFYTRELYLMFIAPTVWLVNSLLTVGNTNILHGPKLTHSKHLLTLLERLPHHVDVVKRIKKKTLGSTFEDICLTALTASITDFFRKSSTLLPKYITAELPALPLSLIKQEKLKGGRMICRNKLTSYTCRLPIDIDSNINKPLANLLKVISKKNSLIRDSLEHEATYFTLRTFCHVLPTTILHLMVKMVQDCTIFVSNIPAPNLVTVLGGCQIQDMCLWAPTRGNTGLGFVIGVYDRRIQISLAVDKALTFKRNEAQSLMDDFFKYLHLLEQETV